MVVVVGGKGAVSRHTFTLSPAWDCFGGGISQQCGVAFSRRSHGIHKDIWKGLWLE